MIHFPACLVHWILSRKMYFPEFYCMKKCNIIIKLMVISVYLTKHKTVLPRHSLIKPNISSWLNTFHIGFRFKIWRNVKSITHFFLLFMLLTICWLEIEPKVEANEKNTKPQSINVPLFKNQNFQESCLSCVGSYHIDFKINKVLSEVKRIIKNSIN